MSEQQLTLRKKQELAMQKLASYLPSSIDPDRFTAFGLAVLRDPSLADCTEQSKMLALADCAKLGLYPDRNLGHVWLVPFKNKAGKEVTLIPGYQGYIELARRSGVVRSIHTGIVFEQDIELGVYREWTDEKGRHLLHEPTPFCNGETRGKPAGVYCVATLADGSSQIESMSWEEVMSVKRRSKAGSSGPWSTDEEMMARKTVVRRARKYWPQSSDLAKLGDWDYRNDGYQQPTTVTTEAAPALTMDDLDTSTTDTQVVADEYEASLAVADGSEAIDAISEAIKSDQRLNEQQRVLLLNFADRQQQSV